MDYEQKYKEALKVMEDLYNVVKYQSSTDALWTSQNIEKAFPELKESEDERVRKEIIQSIQDNMCVIHKDKCIAWLEKQGQVKSIDISIKEKAHQIAWETSKHYDPNACKQEWCEMAALDMASWLEKQGEQKSYWKPTKEQLEALDYAYNICPDTERGNYYEGVLETLIEDLHMLEKQGEQKQYSIKDEKMLDSIIEELRPCGECPDYPTQEERDYYYVRNNMVNWLKSLKERMKGEQNMARELPDKYKTCDWLWNYGSIGLTKEHIKRLNNAINILESLNEHTDAKYLKEIKDKLLQDTSNIEKINNDAFIEKACKWLKESITNNPETNRIISINGTVTMGMLIEDFKNYMKGE